MNVVYSVEVNYAVLGQLLQGVAYTCLGACLLSGASQDPTSFAGNPGH